MNALPWIAAALVGSTTLFLIWRGALVLMLLLIGSLFLGWVSPTHLEVAGSFDVHAALIVFIAIALCFGLARGFVRDTSFGLPMTALACLWLGALLMPVLRGESTPFLALNASKEFMMLFAYFAMVTFVRGMRDLRFAWRAILWLGIYYSLIEIAAQMVGPALIDRMAVDYRPDAFGLWKLYLGFWPVILITLLYAVFAYCQGRRRSLPLLLLALAGLMLTFFRSYLLAFLAIVPCLLLLVRAARESRRAVVELAVVFAFAAALGLLLAGNAFVDASDSFAFSGLRELRDQTGGALAGRQAYEHTLFELTAQRPLFGFGFVQRESAIVQQLSLPAFAGSSLGFIDAGWADVLVKFGYVGGATLLLTWLWILKRVFGIARRTESADVRVRALTVAALILIYIIVLPVHAPLTHSFGLLPLALALGILDGEARREA
ncbi:MAG: O-antigen ligase family protein [Pseudomonadota bacterium]